ncbi:hypothetical protein LSTR_LSTR008848 [Laodelphax striatellus]|uniref:Phospholipid-transporting ATPase n=1 Tax=Laodelphax striatellus TaxID=195883 RepID=A0A482WSP0_LAOST|nr:hypothetical protein LSTR_LSTR008848 [Laodelphax striatellus]
MASSPLCLMEMTSSTTQLVKEDIPLISKPRESNVFVRCCQWIWRRCKREQELRARTLTIGRQSTEKFPANVIRNQKYNVITFLPKVLFQQFKFFLNLYFLLMAMSQFIPELRLGYLYTYWGPLCFVLMVTISREAVDDFRRHQRDNEVNSQKYKRLVRARDGSVITELVPSSKLCVGDLVLFAAVIGLAFVMMCLKGFSGPWYRYMFRFVLLFSYIIPISLRVNLDMGKAFYSWSMQRDQEMPDTVVRCTTIPEELGRISYLLTDKTGTLTQNSMVFKKLHLGTVSYGSETFDQVKQQVTTAYAGSAADSVSPAGGGKVAGAAQQKIRRSEHSRVQEAVKAVALCHNVTPVWEQAVASAAPGDGAATATEESQSEADQHYYNRSNSQVTYQASSPDEVALVKWTEEVGLAVIKRDLVSMTLRTPNNQVMEFAVLQMFPFTSETKRMGIIVKDQQTGEIIFYLKGADVVMSTIVQYTDWLDEECGNMAREGLRTLVVAKKTLTEEQYLDFETRYNAARMSVSDRGSRVAAVIESLEREMELLCVTGVEDRLQDKVRPTLELLRNAGIKVWMLTGDKLETACCIAKSSRLVSRTHELYVFSPVVTRTDAHLQINAFRKKQDAALIITGDSLEVCLNFYQNEFLDLACRSPAVVCCRCSPTQKAQVVRLIQEHTGKRAAAVGDGGNDVSMIQAADTGIGIAGLEGRQASLAADFSISQFSHLARLLLVHGRYSYKRSASLSQFVIHRGLIISTMQAIFCTVFYFASVPLYQGILMVGYATVYTMFPVFSLVLDRDVSDKIVLTYPELYKELSKGRSLSFKTFFMWVLISIYQGGVIMYGALVLFEDEFIHIVAISFTALILTELVMVALTVRTWHYIIVLAELISLLIYLLSLVLLKGTFDANFIQTSDFLWKTTAITLVSCLPLYILKFLRKKFSPPSYSKLS